MVTDKRELVRIHVENTPLDATFKALVKER